MREPDDAGADKLMFGSDFDSVLRVTLQLRRRMRPRYCGLHPCTALPLSEDVARLVRVMSPKELAGWRRG